MKQIHFLLAFICFSILFVDLVQCKTQIAGCKLPENIQNAKLVTLGPDSASTGVIQSSQGNIAVTGTELFIFCFKGFVLTRIDESPLVCVRSGVWSHDFGECIPEQQGGKAVQETQDVQRLARPPPPSSVTQQEQYGGQLPLKVSMPTLPHPPNECDIPLVSSGLIYQVDENGGMVVDRPLLEGERISVGNTIHLVCNPGYRKAMEAFSLASCMNGNHWSNPVGPCVPLPNYEATDSEVEPEIDCGREPAVVNGYIANGKSLVGARRPVICNYGFILQGAEFVECSDYGVWTLPGQCIGPGRRPIVHENKPVQQTGAPGSYGPRGDFHPPFGRVPGFGRPQMNTDSYTSSYISNPNRQSQFQQPVYRQQVPPGYRQRPQQAMTEYDRQYHYAEEESPREIYKDVTCVFDPYIPNGKATRGGSSIGDVRTVYCEPSYVLQGADTIVCSQYGHWSIPGKCVPSEKPGLYHPNTLPGSRAECGQVPAVIGGDFVDDVSYFTTGTLRKKLRCFSGHELVGPDLIFCDAGRWSPPGACIKPGDQVESETKVLFSSCSTAKFIRNGRISLLNDGSRKLFCNTGYSVMETDNIVCDLELGQWKAVGYCLKDDHVNKLNALKTSEIVMFDDRIHYGYSWDRAPFLSEDSGCWNSRYQNGIEGSFWSLHYPCPYENRLTCIWDIRAPEGEYVAIAFNDIFSIEPSKNQNETDCPYDAIEFFTEIKPVSNSTSVQNATVQASSQQKEMAFEKVATFCGLHRPKNMILQSNNIRVSFKTDNRYTGHGFRLMWASMRPTRMKYLMENF